MMKKVEAGKRVIANINSDSYQPFMMESGEAAGSLLQLNQNYRPGVGFHIYKMELVFFQCNNCEFS